MLFNSYDFLFGFLPLTLWAFHAALRRRGPRAAGAVLAAASLGFYGWWYLPYLALLIVSMGVNFELGRRLGDEHTPDERRHRLMMAGVAGNLAVLGWFKYTGWAAEIVEALSGWHVPMPELALPLGISFYTFQQIAYLVDARRGLCREHDLVDYTLFVSFFPQLIAGPIVHHGEMLPQFRAGRIPTDHDRSVGLTFFAAGLVKKVLVADMMVPWINLAYGKAAVEPSISSALAWQGLLAYHFQLYFDFSGYSDMATGLARLFGVKLPCNFDAPYRSDSVGEFWRRWHLTLGRFLRDYIYIPLGGNRVGPARRRFNLWLTLFIAGVWHGAGWTYFWWAVQMATYVAIHDAWVARTGGLPDTRWGVGLGRVMTWFALIATWPLFRADSLSTARTMAEAMFFLGDGEIGRWNLNVVLTFGVLTLWTQLAPTTQQWLRHHDPLLDWRPIDKLTLSDRWSWQPTRGWAIVAGVGLLLCIPVLDRANAFLYWAF